MSIAHPMAPPIERPARGARSGNFLAEQNAVMIPPADEVVKAALISVAVGNLVEADSGPFVTTVSDDMVSDSQTGVLHGPHSTTR